MAHVDRALTANEAALILGVAPRSLLDPRYRVRIGLPATRIGRSLRFHTADVERVLRRGRERLPAVATVAGTEE